ncbi:hypothetical protein GI582_24515 [Sulfitobacter sp. BDSS02]|uniref:hypothetical protein n=1 Tax=Heliomarina sp. TaxID=2917556 RepID=UPI00405840A0|nr:hypothetical protein [Sulfitobacter sp. BDSS02]MBR9852411.1 hypothetical protein [Paracoccaceae bacterium]
MTTSDDTSIGQKSTGVCEDCGCLVTTTFAYRNVRFDDCAGRARSLLVAICNLCGCVVSIPAECKITDQNTRKPFRIGTLAGIIDHVSDFFEGTTKREMSAW